MINLHYLFENIIIHHQKPHDNLDKFIKATNNKNILWSPKIDGVRCLIKCNKNKVNYYTRSNNELFNLNIFDKYITDMCKQINKKYNINYPIILDSELSTKDKKLTSVMTQLIRLNNIDSSLFILNIFDIQINDIFYNRHNIIKNIISNNYIKNNIVILPYYEFNNFNIDNLNKLLKQQVNKGYEGIILTTKDSLYLYNKINPKFFKLKDSNTIDLKVKDIILGRKGTKLENKLAVFIVEYNGNLVKVSGRLNNKQREEFAKSPPIGKIIEIKYKEITKDGSLREPIFIRIREDK